LKYTELASKIYQVPNNFYPELKKDSNDKLTEVILPIGLLSSYVLANKYLKDFDERIIQKIKPAYCGRYVDDILLVIADPDLKYVDKERKDANTDKDNDRALYEGSEITSLEKYVLYNLNPVLELIDESSENYYLEEKYRRRAFKIKDYPNLYCQTDKSLLYFFNAEGSDLVIDKLKKDLEERTSEFRDFPDENSNEDTFEKSAYHLYYDGDDGKISTLKDYKENRFGLTVYLANKIFSALRHEKRITEMRKIRS